MVARETWAMEIEGRVPSPGGGQGCAAWGHAAYSRRRGTARRSLAPLRTPFGVRVLLHTFSPGRRVRADPGLSAETPPA